MRVPSVSSSSFLLLGALACAASMAAGANEPSTAPAEEVVTTSIARAKMGWADAPLPDVAVATTSSLRGAGDAVMDKQQTPDADKADKAFWTVFYANGDQSMIHDLGGNRMGITIGPWKESVGAQSAAQYNGGKLEFKVKSAAVMPGVITAVYLSSGQGRTGDDSTGSQDEIDLEFKGNEPFKVQSNVFFNGQENLQMLDLGFDSSADEHMYAIEWDDTTVNFYIDGELRQTVNLYRPLQPMQLHLSVWTTTGGWPGLIKWGGNTDWGRRGGQPVEAVIEFTSYPNKAY